MVFANGDTITGTLESGTNSVLTGAIELKMLCIDGDREDEDGRPRGNHGGHLELLRTELQRDLRSVQLRSYLRGHHESQWNLDGEQPQRENRNAASFPAPSPQSASCLTSKWHGRIRSTRRKIITATEPLTSNCGNGSWNVNYRITSATMPPDGPAANPQVAICP
jgi:hypothetical protein